MGMALALHTLSDENLGRILEQPALIWRVIAPDDPDIYRETVSGKGPGLLARLTGAKRDDTPVEVPDLPTAPGEFEETDLDKAWHGIHYLLTGTAWEGPEPLNFLLCGGRQAGNIDVGYGPARVLSSDEVKAVDVALAGIDEDSLRERFDPDEMLKLDIYPDIWDRDPEEDDTLGYCLEFFAELKAFIAEASKRSLGIVLYVC